MHTGPVKALWQALWCHRDISPSSSRSLRATLTALWHTALCGNDGTNPLVTCWCAQGLAWAEGMAQVFGCSMLGTGGHAATLGMVLPSRHSFTNLFLLGSLTWRLLPEMGLLCLGKGRRPSGDPQLPRNAPSICLFIYF